MIRAQYKAQVELLLDVLPYVAKEKSFAMKGGTAINMFVWDMPRLSVDIDLTYTQFDDRNTALATISENLTRIQKDILASIAGVQVKASETAGQKDKLLCTRGNTGIKIEVNTTMRGSIKPAELKQVSPAVRKEFDKFAAIQIVSQGELFGGKICAALDRQHPRDLFDIHQLFNAGGITEEIKDGFIAALLSHNRPIHEMLKPNLQNQQEAFASQFEGMALRPFSYADFEASRERLVTNITGLLTEKDKQLLLSFKAGKPDWSLSNLAELQNLPAIKWKLANLQKLAQQNAKKHQRQIESLESVLL